MSFLHEVSIGATYHDGYLSVAVRVNHEILAPIEHHHAEHVASAAALVMAARQVHWRDLPRLHVTGDDATPLMEALRDNYRAFPEGNPRPVDTLVDWYAQAGATYANQGSRLFADFAERIRSADVLLPADAKLTEELVTFERTYLGGAVSYTAPDQIARTFNRYPARALAVLLAAIPAPRRHVARQSMNYDPVAQAARNPW